jgi:hypothetical protein
LFLCETKYIEAVTTPIPPSIALSPIPCSSHRIMTCSFHSSYKTLRVPRNSLKTYKQQGK